jgi:Ser/Thr protein kinase RdoA (MazF antagonist)
MRKSLQAELRAAQAVAANAGLGDIQPEILKLAHHTTVRLAPTDVVARIQTRDNADDPKLFRELMVASHLASRAAPAVRPAAKVNPGPHFEGGCAITLWQLVAGRPAADGDAIPAASALQHVHRALDDMRIPLPPFTVAFESCERILDAEAEAPMLGASDRLFLQELYRELRQDLDGRELRCRPLHGDAHLGNVLVTTAGAIWLDLDDVCMGPIEWDVACLPRDAWSQFDRIDRNLTQLLADLRSLCVSLWCWADFERNADTRQAAVNHLNALKARFGDSAAT